MRGIDKRFPGVHALDRVDFDVRPGEVHGLMGQNGAGKSTLIKVLTGVHPRDGGTITFEAQPFRASSPADAQRKGISTVYQEINLVPSLSVAENLFLGRLKKGTGSERSDVPVPFSPLSASNSGSSINSASGGMVVSISGCSKR